MFLLDFDAYEPNKFFDDFFRIFRPLFEMILKESLGIVRINH